MKNLKVTTKIFMHIAKLTAVLLTFTFSPLHANETVASKSTEIVVPQDFNFSLFKEMNIDVSVSDEYHYAIEGAIIRFYSYNEDDSEDESIVFIGKTNSSGWLTAKVEMPHYVKKLKISVHAIGYENDASLNIEGKDEIKHNF